MSVQANNPSDNSRNVGLNVTNQGSFITSSKGVSNLSKSENLVAEEYFYNEPVLSKAVQDKISKGLSQKDAINAVIKEGGNPLEMDATAQYGIKLKKENDGGLIKSTMDSDTKAMLFNFIKSSIAADLGQDPADLGAFQMVVPFALTGDDNGVSLGIPGDLAGQNTLQKMQTSDGDSVWVIERDGNFYSANVSGAFDAEKGTLDRNLVTGTKYHLNESNMKLTKVSDNLDQVTDSDIALFVMQVGMSMLDAQRGNLDRLKANLQEQQRVSKMLSHAQASVASARASGQQMTPELRNTLEEVFAATGMESPPNLNIDTGDKDVAKEQWKAIETALSGEVSRFAQLSNEQLMEFQHAYSKFQVLYEFISKMIAKQERLIMSVVQNM